MKKSVLLFSVFFFVSQLQAQEPQRSAFARALPVVVALTAYAAVHMTSCYVMCNRNPFCPGIMPGPVLGGIYGNLYCSLESMGIGNEA